jgi:hypothetical protein
MKFSQLVFQSNIIDLKSYLRKAPESNKARINEVIKLYEDKKIKHIKTALTTVASLASTNKKIQLIQGSLQGCMNKSLKSIGMHYQ